MQTYIPKICSIFLLTNRCSNSKIRLCKQMFVISVRGIYNTDLQLMIQGGTVMRNESNTITGRTCQMSGNTSSRIHSGDVSRNRRIVVRRQKIALVSVAFVALAIVICTFFIRCGPYSGSTIWDFLQILYKYWSTERWYFMVDRIRSYYRGIPWYECLYWRSLLYQQYLNFL